MKQFKEYLAEATTYVSKGSAKDFPDQTPGKPAKWADGSEVPGSLSLSKNSFITRSGEYYVINSVIGLSGDLHTITIPKAEFELLKKFH